MLLFRISAFVCSGAVSIPQLFALYDAVVATGVRFVEGERLEAGVRLVLAWRAKSERALACRSSLQQLKELAAEARAIESMRVDLGAECAPVDEQLAKAEAWLTRMNSVVAQKDKQAAKKKTRAGREKAAKKGDAGDSKVCIADVSQLMDDAAAIGIDVSSEMGEMGNIIDTAESWAASVRAALESDSSDEALESLIELLREAQDLPVTLKEEGMLRAEVEARQWANRVRKGEFLFIYIYFLLTSDIFK